ncbi:hypothetical protein [Bacteroides ihuae]|uniref:hypothetical protein n=1 Tax=Bacteroides ihuae TaxID=1852362 RepID=UPI0008DA0AC4|nr:hypothetical protein [Bacteroides ihuae]
MEPEKLFKFLFFLLSILSGVSCSNDDSLIKPSTSFVSMEGEGGESVITFDNADWTIARVINKDGNINLTGNIYSKDGELLSESTPLTLSGLGSMESIWSDKGCRIVRDTPTSLKIILNENMTDDDFNFIILLQLGQEEKEITVQQKKSEGYTFDKIEYALNEGDGDSIYTGESKRSSFNYSEPFELTMDAMIDILQKSYFESTESDAFLWTDNDSILVKTPSSIYNGTIYYANVKSVYNNLVSKKPLTYKVTETMTIPAGKLKLETEIEYRRLKVSYLLTLINNRTGEKKTIHGKWIDILPIGSYSTISSDE